VTLAAKALQVDRVVCAALLNFDNVMHLQIYRRAKILQVVFSAQALPAVVAPIQWEKWPQIFV
jgi:hypothetical protein